MVSNTIFIINVPSDFTTPYFLILEFWFISSFSTTIPSMSGIIKTSEALESVCLFATDPIPSYSIGKNWLPFMSISPQRLFLFTGIQLSN